MKGPIYSLVLFLNFQSYGKPISRKFLKKNQKFQLFLVFAFDCNGRLGPVPHPDECSSFYLCDHNLANLFTCQQGLVFDENLLVCNYEYAVDCEGRQNTMSTTEKQGTD